MLSPRDIIHFYCTVAKPHPKHKFAIVACTQPKLRLLLVNSEVNSLVISTPELLAHQVPIDKASHGFLSYDSHVDCANPLGGDFNTLCRQIADGETQIKAVASDAVIAAISNVVANSELLSGYDVKWILDGLADDPQVVNVTIDSSGHVVE